MNISKNQSQGVIRKRLERFLHLEDVASNTGWLFADNILRAGVGFLVGVWVTRYLGPERYGQLSYAVAFVAMLSSVALLGLDGIVVRNLIRTPAHRETIVGTAFFLKLTGAIVTATSIMAAILLIRHDDPMTQALVGITSLGLIFQSFGSIDFFFQSQLKAKYCACSRSIAFLVCSSIKVALIIYQAPLIAFAWIGTAETALGAIGFLAAYRMNSYSVRSWRLDIGMAKSLLRDSWPLILTDIVMMLSMRIDKIIIGEISGNAELGIYAVAALVAEALYFIPLSLASSCFPGIVAAREESEALFLEKLQHFYNVMAFAGYAVAIPMSLIAGWGIPLLFGDSYARAGNMLIGLTWASLFINMGFARSYFLTAMNWTRLHFITDLLGCAANITLNLILVPRYGAMGAVVASAISYWLAAHGSCFLFRPLIPTGIMLTRALCLPKPW